MCNDKDVISCGSTFHNLCSVSTTWSLGKSSNPVVPFEPAAPTNLSDAQRSLRRWLRLYNRTSDLQLHYPGPSLLVKGLDRLSHHISKASNAGFRLASYRHAQFQDYEPTQHSVLAYAPVLLGEVEQQLLAQDLSQAKQKRKHDLQRPRLTMEINLSQQPSPRRSQGVRENCHKGKVLGRRLRLKVNLRRPKRTMQFGSLAGSLSPQMDVGMVELVISHIRRFRRVQVDAMSVVHPHTFGHSALEGMDRRSRLVGASALKG